MVKDTKAKDESKENLKLETIANKTTKNVIVKPKATIATKTKAKTIATAIPTTTSTATAMTRDEKESKKTLRIKPQVTQVPSETTVTTTTTPAQTTKPSLLPKPKVKVVIPPALLQKQQQQHPQQQSYTHQQQQQFEEYEEVLDEHELDYTVDEEHEPEAASTPSSRIPVRTANAEKHALLAGIISSSEETSPPSTSDLKKSKVLIK